MSIGHKKHKILKSHVISYFGSVLSFICKIKGWHSTATLHLHLHFSPSCPGFDSQCFQNYIYLRNLFPQCFLDLWTALHCLDSVQCRSLSCWWLKPSSATRLRYKYFRARIGFSSELFEPTCHGGGHKRDGLHGSADDGDLVEAETDVEHLKGHEGPRQHGTWKKFNCSLSFL